SRERARSDVRGGRAEGGVLRRDALRETRRALFGNRGRLRVLLRSGAVRSERDRSAAAEPRILLSGPRRARRAREHDDRLWHARRRVSGRRAVRPVPRASPARRVPGPRAARGAPGLSRGPERRGRFRQEDAGPVRAARRSLDPSVRRRPGWRTEEEGGEGREWG